MSFQQSNSLLKEQNLGLWAILQTEGQGQARCSLVPSPMEERRQLSFNGILCQKTRFAGKRGLALCSYQQVLQLFSQ